MDLNLANSLNAKNKSEPEIWHEYPGWKQSQKSPQRFLMEDLANMGTKRFHYPRHKSTRGKKQGVQFSLH